MTRTLSSLRRRSGTAPLAVAALFSFDAPAEAQLGAIRSQVWVDGSASDQDRFGHSVSSGDFDCDGFADLAVGAPFEDADGGAPENVGSVLVLYGGAAGLTASGHQFWNQLNLADEMEAGDNFGWVLTTGDFDGDECDDLAIGIPFEAIGAESGAGAVAVVYGGPGTGLTATGNRLFWQGDGAISGVAEPLDYFGSSLAAADFDDDGTDDLAIGAPGENLGATADAGVVHLVYGSASGLTGAGDLLLYRGNGLPGAPDPDEQLGGVLAAGELGGLTPGADLVIGAPFSSYDSGISEGRVLVILGVGGALPSMGEYTQSTPGVPGASENGDHFGWSLAVGDFDGDGIDEIAVGSPGENLESPDIPDVGAVTILDLSGGNHDLILQSEIPPQEPPEQTDSFGYRLVAADFDADGVTDLAIGTQSEDVGGLVDVGIVHELFGSEGSGLDVASATTWHQTLMEEEDNDNFGASLAAGRFSGHSGSDLAIGVPGKTVFGNVAAGAVNVFYSVALFLDGFENGLDPWSDTEP